MFIYIGKRISDGRYYKVIFWIDQLLGKYSYVKIF